MQVAPYGFVGQGSDLETAVSPSREVPQRWDKDQGVRLSEPHHILEGWLPSRKRGGAIASHSSEAITAQEGRGRSGEVTFCWSRQARQHIRRTKAPRFTYRVCAGSTCTLRDVQQVGINPVLGFNENKWERERCGSQLCFIGPTFSLHLLNLFFNELEQSVEFK